MPQSPVVTVEYNSAGWNTKTIGAINSGNYLRIVFKGSLASQLKAKVENFTVTKVPAPPLPFVPIPYPKIAISSCLAGTPTLLSLVLTALTLRGYSTIKARYQAHGSGVSDDELTLDLR